MKKAVLLVCAEVALRHALRRLFASGGLQIAECADRAKVAASGADPDTAAVVFASSRGEESWKDACAAGQIRWPVILVAGESSEELAIHALRKRVCDLIRYPQAVDELIPALERLLGHTAGPSESVVDPIIGGGKFIRQLKSFLAQVAATDSNVLITGETGTGKELVAARLHSSSPRRAKRLIPVNCAAIPETLVESELFGYERGAFTGAEASREGKFQMADGGTVFLDEIGDMDLGSQAKLLRAIESKEVHSLGSKTGMRLNLRFVAATNQDPEQMVRENRFRKDLYFRLNVARVHLAPLRERKEDIRLLVEHSIRDLNRRFGYQVEGCTADAWALLDQHDWPGNVRELKNLMEATFIGLGSRLISAKDFPEAFRRQLEGTAQTSADERERLLSALSTTNWNKSKAAEALRWSRMTIYRKIAKYHLSSRS